MTSSNISDYMDGFLYPMNLPALNSSFFLEEVTELQDVGSLPEVIVRTNATQQILANGTRTRAPSSPKSPMKSFTGPMVLLLSYYTCPAILVVGLLSNLLAYLVFTRTHLRKVPSVPYMAAMAVVDSGALITDFIQNGLVQHGIGLITWSGVCQYVTYFNFVFIFLCIWYPVALCVEKFISVYCPLRKAALCTPFRAKVVVIGMAIMTGTCYYYVIYMTGPIKFRGWTVCREWSEFRNDFHLLMKLDSVFVSALPSFVLILLMVLICFRGCEYYRISSAADVSSRVGSTARSASIRAPIRVTNVIFPVVFITLLLKVPLSFMRFYVMLSQQNFGQFGKDLQPVFLYLGKFEWAIKLYIYLIFSPSFRRRTKSFVCGVTSRVKGRCKTRRSSSSEEDDFERIPRINLAERVEGGEGGANTRACLMSSDV